MTSIRTILCAVDFSAPSREAMKFAADLARRYDATLTLAHVYNPPTGARGEVLLAPPEVFEAAAHEMDRSLELWRVDAQELSGKYVATAVLDGAPADEIVRYALERRFDLVVLATHGRTGLKRLVLGSVAEHVVRRAPCPVVVVREPEPFDED